MVESYANVFHHFRKIESRILLHKKSDDLVFAPDLFLVALQWCRYNKSILSWAWSSHAGKSQERRL